MRENQHRLLRRTFIHFGGVGPEREQKLWASGVADWDALATEASQIFKAGKRLDALRRGLDQSLEAWERRDLYFFHRALPPRERWRLIPADLDGIAYFDIEASGGGMPPSCHSTAIAFYFRGEVLQEHETHKKRALIERILDEAAVLVTYNGASYDVPFLTAEFATPFHRAHVDLCPWLRRLGLKGGLKGVQKALPHIHQRVSMDIDGYDAVRLWRLHESGEGGALETLLTYNAEDAIVLEPLLCEAWNREVKERPELALEPLVSPPVTSLSTAVVPRIYELLRSSGSSRPQWLGFGPSAQEA